MQRAQDVFSAANVLDGEDNRTLVFAQPILAYLSAQSSCFPRKISIAGFPAIASSNCFRRRETNPACLF